MILIGLFIFSGITNKELLLSNISKTIISIIIIIMICKSIRYKAYLILILNISFIFLIFYLSNNSLKDGMMNNIEMYYVDKYQPQKYLISDLNFSNEASHQKYYAKHASEIKPSALKYIEYGKNLKFTEIYYYELCLFFENNVCVFNWNREVNKLDYVHEQSDFKYNKLKSYYRGIDFVTELKEGILKRDNKFKDIKELHNLDCLYLFYGAQNGWKSYQIELLKKIKLENQCYIDLNNHFKFVAPNLESENKKNLINFLESINNI